MLYLAKDGAASQSLFKPICTGCYYWLRFAITWRKSVVGFPVVQVGGLYSSIMLVLKRGLC
jgi:hypothetical protein